MPDKSILTGGRAGFMARQCEINVIRVDGRGPGKSNRIICGISCPAPIVSLTRLRALFLIGGKGMDRLVALLSYADTLLRFKEVCDPRQNENIFEKLLTVCNEIEKELNMKN